MNDVTSNVNPLNCAFCLLRGQKCFVSEPVLIVGLCSSVMYWYEFKYKLNMNIFNIQSADSNLCLKSLTALEVEK